MRGHSVLRDLYANWNKRLCVQPGGDDVRHWKVNDYSGHYWEIVVRSLSEGTATSRLWSFSRNHSINVMGSIAKTLAWLLEEMTTPNSWYYNAQRLFVVWTQCYHLIFTMYFSLIKHYLVLFLCVECYCSHWLSGWEQCGCPRVLNR